MASRDNRPRRAHEVARPESGASCRAPRSDDGVTDDPFVAHRRPLCTVAYEMLGSVADAEGVLQDAWLRWADVDESEVRDPGADLIGAVTHQALNRLRTLSRRRQEHVGRWLPEPVSTLLEVAEDAVLAESVSIAMLTVLETFELTERAVSRSPEGFGLPHGEIADAIGKSDVTVRQIARRACQHAAARRPRVKMSPWTNGRP
jgi:DNA-directed RNA polymerase specialized sigma24 family protein